MRTTLNLDDDLLAEAVELTGIQEKTALLQESLRALIERESARRLAKLGGSEPELERVSRRQSELGNSCLARLSLQWLISRAGIGGRDSGITHHLPRAL
ncbi:MAG: type II toxin-antitoxin system VapB family antitoxin [Thiotrichales bacterium]